MGVLELVETVMTFILTFWAVNSLDTQAMFLRIVHWYTANTTPAYFVSQVFDLNMSTRIPP